MLTQEIKVELKITIDSNIPESKNQLIWTINNMGKYLFNNELWEKHNIYKNETEEKSDIIEGILQLINQVCSEKEDKEELIKYVFGKALNKLTNM